MGMEMATSLKNKKLFIKDNYGIHLVILWLYLLHSWHVRSYKRHLYSFVHLLLRLKFLLNWYLCLIFYRLHRLLNLLWLGNLLNNCIIY